jgi:hypothetical protein
MTQLSKPVVFVDVDDTLVRSFGTKRIPITAVVDKVRTLHAAGYTIYCWSSGGSEYCRSTAADLGIAHCFVGFLPKPQILIDDQHPSDWRLLKWLHTNEVDGFPDDQDENGTG